MKNILIYVFLLFTTTIFADCSYNGMGFLPKSKEISLNPYIIIEGYVNSQVTVKSFKNRQIYLKTEDNILIELKLIETLISRDVTQAIFKVSKTLMPNTKYFIFYSNQTDNEAREMLEYNELTKKHEPKFWLTANLTQQKILISDLKITYDKNEIKSYGCGDSVKSIFNITSTNNVEIWYRTELTEVSTGLKTIIYLTQEDEKIYVGKGMCGGPFRYNDNTNYIICFTPTNIDGKTLEKTKSIEFKSPYDTENSFNRFKRK